MIYCTHGRLTEFVFLGECLDVVGRIGAHGEQTDHRRAGVTLVPHFLNVQNHALRVLVAQRVGNVFACHGHGAIRTPGAHQEQTPEHVQRVVIAVRDDFLLRGLFIKPLLPLTLVTRNLYESITKSYINNTYRYMYIKVELMICSLVLIVVSLVC